MNAQLLLTSQLEQIPLGYAWVMNNPTFWDQISSFVIFNGVFVVSDEWCDGDPQLACLLSEVCMLSTFLTLFNKWNN